MGATAPPPIGARLDPEICVNPIRNMQGELGGVRRLFAGSGFHCTAYNVGIIYTCLCHAGMNYGTDS